MAKTLRVRTRTGWVTKPVADTDANRLSAEEVDDNFLALEDEMPSGLAELPVDAIGASSVNVTLDMSLYSAFELEPTAAITVTVGGVATGARALAYVTILNGGEQAITFGSEVTWAEEYLELGPVFSSAPVARNCYVPALTYTGVVARSAFDMGGSGVGTYCFSSDGAYFFIAQSSGTEVRRFELSTPFDITTQSYAGIVFDWSATTTNTAAAITFSDAGTLMYVAYNDFGSSDYSIRRFDLGTAWDVSTASYAHVLDVGSTSYFSMRVADDGSFLLACTGSEIARYAMSPAYNIATAVVDDRISFSNAGQGLTARGAVISGDGKRLMAGDIFAETVYEYVLGTPWKLSTMRYTGESFSTTGTNLDLVRFIGSKSGHVVVMEDTDSSQLELFTAQETLPAGTVHADVIQLLQYGGSEVMASFLSTGVRVIR